MIIICVNHFINDFITLQEFIRYGLYWLHNIVTEISKK